MKIKLIVSVIFVSKVSSLLALDSFSYSGRLVNTNGSPVTGSVNLRFDLSSTQDSSDVLCSKTINEVPLSQGIFNVKLDFLPADCENNSIQSIMESIPAGHSLTYQVTDLTNSRSYAQQAIYSVPSSFIASYAKSLSSMGATSDGQVLKWSASTGKWIPGTVGSGNGTITSINTGSGLAGGPIENNGTIFIAPAGVEDSHLASGINPAKLSGTRDASKYLKGDNSWSSFEADLLATILNGFSPPATASAVTSSDSVLEAFGKLQGQASTLESNKLDKTGGTLIIGTIDGVPTPTLPSQIVNKLYVDELVNDVNPSQWTTATPHIHYNTGNVGIGTATPDSKLSIVGDVSLCVGIKFKSNTHTVEFKPSGTTTEPLLFILPPNKGSVGETLVTDGDGNLSWSAPVASKQDAFTVSPPLAYDAGTDVLSIGAVPPSLGGTGLTNPGASGNLLMSDGANWVSWSPNYLSSESDPSVFPFAKTSLPTCGMGEVLNSNGTLFSCVPDANTILTTDNISLETSGSTIRVKAEGILDTHLSGISSSCGLGQILVTNGFGSFSCALDGVAIGGSTASSSAILDLQSTTKGFLPPRMTTAQREGIASPVNGLIVYDTDEEALLYFSGGEWKSSGSVSPSTSPSMSLNFSPAPVTYMKFDNSMNDESTTYTATGTNTGYGKGLFGQSLFFNGTNSHAKLDDNLQLLTGGDFTASIWVRINTNSTSHNIFNFRNLAYGNEASDRKAGFLIIQNGMWRAVYKGSSDAVQIEKTANFGPAVGEWSHVALRKVGNNFNVFINGTLVPALTATTSGTTQLTSNIMALGRHYYSGDTNAFLNGELDDFAMWDSALTDSKIQSIYQMGSSVSNGGSTIIANESISLDHVDFASPEGINIPQLSSNPASGSEGQIYYNTTTKTLMFHDGSDWQAVGAGGGGGGSGNVKTDSWNSGSNAINTQSITLDTASVVVISASIEAVHSNGVLEFNGARASISVNGAVCGIDQDYVGADYNRTINASTSCIVNLPAGTHTLKSETTGNNIQSRSYNKLSYVAIPLNLAGGGGTGADNLGNHTATQNLKLGANWISGDGDSEGISVRTNGNVGIGTNTPDQKLSVAGMIETTSGGLKFPDGTIQTTASVDTITKLVASASEPHACSASSDGVLALTAKYTTCVCRNGVGWVSTVNGTDACMWSSYFSGTGTVADPYRRSNEASSDLTTSATSCNWYRLNAVTDPLGTTRVPGATAFPNPATNGVYRITPSGAGSAVNVYCDMTTNDGGWTLVSNNTDNGAGLDLKTKTISPTSLTTKGNLRFDDFMTGTTEVRVIYNDIQQFWVTENGTIYSTDTIAKYTWTIISVGGSWNNTGSSWTHGEAGWNDYGTGVWNYFANGDCTGCFGHQMVLFGNGRSGYYSFGNNYQNETVGMNGRFTLNANYTAGSTLKIWIR